MTGGTGEEKSRAHGCFGNGHQVSGQGIIPRRPFEAQYAGSGTNRLGYLGGNRFQCGGVIDQDQLATDHNAVEGHFQPQI